MKVLTLINPCIICKTNINVKSSLISTQLNDRIIFCSCDRKSAVMPNLRLALDDWNLQNPIQYCDEMEIVQ